jgi:hypothetical protein
VGRTDSSFVSFHKWIKLQVDLTYEGVCKSFRTGRLVRELQLVHLSAIRCICIDILWVSLVSFAAITLCIASQRVIPKASLYIFTDSVRKLLVTPLYKVSRPVLGSFQPPIQCVPRSISPRIKRPGMKLVTNLYLVTRSRMHRAIYHIPHYVFMA